MVVLKTGISSRSLLYGWKLMSAFIFPKKHILLVEDYQPNILLTTILLEEFGYAYTTASNGIEAVEKTFENNFDAILMDVRMDGLDGYQATAKIREWESSQNRRRTPIIAMTANAFSSDREKCIEAGMDDYIAKPFSHEQLRKKLSALFGNQEVSAA